MAKRRGMIFVALGALLAVAVGVLVFIITQSAASSKVVTGDVVVALQDIPDRTVIQPAAVAVKRMPVSAIPNGAFTLTDDVVGKMTPIKIFAGEIILASKLIDSKGQTALSFTMEKGKVLLTFPASNIVGLGLIKPGDAVDVLVTYRPSKNKNAPQSSTAETQTPDTTQATMQNLRVVSIGGQTVAPSNPSPQQQQQQNQPSFVTFAIDPQDALTLKSLKDSEDLAIELALRAAGDDSIFRTEPVTLRGVLERYGIRVSPSSP
ncbi:MAG: Flp pilus assembly protein CpaB [Chloroflexi bacterium]|nr:Flp pilus assembly protein CpaB [Chloroflexota bacterium]